MSVKIQLRGPRHGVCNICGETRELTEDHTPPKGITRASAMEIRSIVDRLSSGAERPKYLNAQNGIRYRTLCKQCNNGRLGTLYDPDYIAISNAVADRLRSPLNLPVLQYFRTRPQRLLRSVIGHILAQGVDRYLKGDITIPLRDYMTKPGLPLPRFLDVFYWVYPFKSIVLVRDAARLSIRHDVNPYIFHLIKSFPLAFLVVIDGHEFTQFSMLNFDGFRHLSVDDEVDLPVRMKLEVPEGWPEAPSKDGYVLHTRDAIVAVPKQLKRPLTKP